LDAEAGRSFIARHMSQPLIFIAFKTTLNRFPAIVLAGNIVAGGL